MAFKARLAVSALRRLQNAGNVQLKEFRVLNAAQKKCTEGSAIFEDRKLKINHFGPSYTRVGSSDAGLKDIAGLDKFEAGVTKFERSIGMLNSSVKNLNTHIESLSSDVQNLENKFDQTNKQLVELVDSVVKQNRIFIADRIFEYSVSLWWYFLPTSTLLLLWNWGLFTARTAEIVLQDGNVGDLATFLWLFS